MSESEAKIMGQFRLTLGGILSAFDAYGMGVAIPEAMRAIEELSLQMHRRMSGEDIPYQVDFNSERRI